MAESSDMTLTASSDDQIYITEWKKLRKGYKIQFLGENSKIRTAKLLSGSYKPGSYNGRWYKCVDEETQEKFSLNLSKHQDKLWIGYHPDTPNLPDLKTHYNNSQNNEYKALEIRSNNEIKESGKEVKSRNNESQRGMVLSSIQELEEKYRQQDNQINNQTLQIEKLKEETEY